MCCVKEYGKKGGRKKTSLYRQENQLNKSHGNRNQEFQRNQKGQRRDKGKIRSGEGRRRTGPEEEAQEATLTVDKPESRGSLRSSQEAACSLLLGQRCDLASLIWSQKKKKKAKACLVSRAKAVSIIQVTRNQQRLLPPLPPFITYHHGYVTGFALFSI